MAQAPRPSEGGADFGGSLQLASSSQLQAPCQAAMFVSRMSESLKSFVLATCRCNAPAAKDAPRHRLPLRH